MFKGKKLSILGDSLSTYNGISNDFRSNRTIRQNEYYYEMPFLSCDTYWGILLNELGLELCVNNSYSGAFLSGRDISSSGVFRANELSASDGTNPDFIIVFMGINDYGNYVDPQTFAQDYELTLEIIKRKYKNARVCCVNLPNRNPLSTSRVESFNEGIENAVRKMGEGYFVADFFGSEMSGDNFYKHTNDDVHPNKDGMRLIADFIIKSFKENIK